MYESNFINIGMMVMGVILFLISLIFRDKDGNFTISEAYFGCSAFAIFSVGLIGLIFFYNNDTRDIILNEASEILQVDKEDMEIVENQEVETDYNLKLDNKLYNLDYDYDKKEIISISLVNEDFIYENEEN